MNNSSDLPRADRAARLRAMGAAVSHVPGDETDEGWAQPGATVDPDTGGSESGDAALQREVPPHHGA